MTAQERVATALERIAAALEAQNVMLAQGSDEQAACAHPADEREDHSTMGHQRWRCKVCGFSVGME